MDLTGMQMRERSVGVSNTFFLTVTVSDTPHRSRACQLVSQMVSGVGQIPGSTRHCSPKLSCIIHTDIPKQLGPASQRLTQCRSMRSVSRLRAGSSRH